MAFQLQRAQEALQPRLHSGIPGPPPETRDTSASHIATLSESKHDVRDSLASVGELPMLQAPGTPATPQLNPRSNSPVVAQAPEPLSETSALADQEARTAEAEQMSTIPHLHAAPEELHFRKTATEWLSAAPGYCLLRQHTDINVQSFLSDEYLGALYTQKQRLLQLITEIIEGKAGLITKYGFQRGRYGAAHQAKVSLCEDLTGYPGKIVPDATAIATLHMETFSNYNIWAGSVGAQLVTSWRANTPTDTEVKLVDLCLWYLIKTEASSLRFCPELLAWIFHQMRFTPKYYMIPTQDLQTDNVEQGGSQSVFYLHTVLPFYQLMLATLSAPESKGPQGQLRNSSRVNYDDLNEIFWKTECLVYSPSDLDASMGVRALLQHELKKRFREYSSYFMLVINLAPWWLFLAVLFHALLGVAQAITEAGGTNFDGLFSASFARELELASRCVLTLAVGKCVLVVCTAVLTAREGSGSYLKITIKGVYHAAWVAGLFAALYLTGFSGLWWGLFAARMVCLAIANGVLHPILGRSWLTSVAEYHFADIERVFTSVAHGGTIAGNLLRQDIRSILAYTAIWLLILIVKIIFNIQIITQTMSSAIRVDSLSISYAWGFTGSGLENVWIAICLWAETALMFCVDSYVLYALVVPLIGALIVRHDGIGHIRSFQQVTRALIVPRRLHGRQMCLMEAFCRHTIPAALEAQQLLSEIGTSSIELSPASKRWLAEARLITSCSFIFGSAWNLMVHSMRDEDLLSDEELAMMTFGRGSEGRQRRWPLWLAGSARPVLCDATLLHGSALIAQSDSELERLCESQEPVHFDAAVEVLQLVPKILELCITASQANMSEMINDVGKLCAIQDKLAGRWYKIIRTCDQAAACISNEHLVSAVHDACAILLGIVQEQPNHTLLMAGQAILHHGALLLAALGVALDAEEKAALAGLQSHLRESSPAASRSDLFKDRLRSIGEDLYRAYMMTSMTIRYVEDFSPQVPEVHRRLTFWTNSIYMRSLPYVDSVIQMTSFSALTPHFAEPVIYPQAEFLDKTNEHGVSPLMYLQSLHASEWQNFEERMRRSDVKESTNLVEKAMHSRLWASMRGQTLARTVYGVMHYAKAFKMLAFHELVIRAVIGACRKMEAGEREPGNLGRVLLESAIAAEWLTVKKIQYVCCCQKYADNGPQDIIRRTDIDFLLSRHPLLSVVYFEDLGEGAAPSLRYFTVCVNASGLIGRFPMPGHPVKDGLGEGKPENQNNGAPFLRGRIVQVLDMNQEGYLEEALKLPHVLQEFQVRGRTKRPVALVGTREHVFTQSLATPAMFMSYQELQFGVVLQRVMYDPLRVRLHYGHPDFTDKVFMTTRGGFAKASKIINVSEDVFAGLMVALRGGESKHIEFMQCGKGRDVGMLQISQFEAKVSGGCAIAMTTRDALRMSANLEFFRMLSLYHSWQGYYITNVLATLSITYFLYFFVILAISGADQVIFGSDVDLTVIGDILIAQWVLAVGGVFIIPIVALLVLENGLLHGLWSTLHMIFTMGPLFYVAEMQTKAYYFDQALSFGKQSYIATGRDFVIRHVPFTEIYSSVAFSHFYLGLELFFVMILISVFGSFSSIVAAVFFFIGMFCDLQIVVPNSGLRLNELAASWVFILSITFAFLWFNPFALELRYVLADGKGWLSWLINLGEPTPSGQFSLWLMSKTGQYQNAPVWTRIYHILRLIRFPVLAIALLFRVNEVRSSPEAGVSEGIFLGAAFGVPLIVLLVFEAGERVALRIAQTRGWLRSTVRVVVQGIAVGALVAAAILLIIFGSVFGELTGGGTIEMIIVFFLMLWFYVKVVFVVSFRWLYLSATAVHRLYDFFLGGVLLLVQLLFAAIPYGSTSHNALLFTKQYAHTLELIIGASKDNTTAARSTPSAAPPA